MAKRVVKPKPKRYFLRNPAGAIHEVTYDHAKKRLKEHGFFMATLDEIKAYRDAKGHQVSGKPLGRPFAPEPEPEPEPEESKEE